MIRNFWVIEKASGHCLFERSYGKNVKDSDLISGFISALTSFSEIELEGEKLSIVETDGRKWVYRYLDPLIFVVIGAKGDPEAHLKAQVSFLANSFLDAFPELKDESGRKFLTKWSGERTYFSKFEPLADQLVAQWGKVNDVNKAAKTLDVIEIYQRIFNAIVSGITTHKGKICTEFEDAVENFHKQCNVRIISNLSDRNPTLDLMSIDVFATSYERLKGELGSLLAGLIKILKKTLPDEQVEKIMHSKVVPIMKSDWKRIDIYNIDPTLISLL